MCKHLSREGNHKVIPRAPAIFGMSDGMVCAAGIVAGLIIVHAAPGLVWSAAFSAGLAEFAGMAAGQFESAPNEGWFAAFVCGLASLIGAVAPAFAYLFLSGVTALAVSLLVTAILCGFIAHIMPGRHGWKSYLISYGVMTAAILLCVAGAFIPH